MDTHKFLPNRKGLCQHITGKDGMCHLPEDAPVHKKREVPEEIQARLASVAAQFKAKYGVQHDDIVDFMLDIIGIYDDYITEEVKKL